LCFISGYKFSRASYVLSLLRPIVHKDLELKVRKSFHIFTNLFLVIFCLKKINWWSRKCISVLNSSEDLNLFCKNYQDLLFVSWKFYPTMKKSKLILIKHILSSPCKHECFQYNYIYLILYFIEIWPESISEGP
jgi:hypothetical protein